MYVLLGVSFFVGSVISYRTKLERALKKPFENKRLIWGANIGLFLAFAIWSIERMVFDARYASPTLADYSVVVLVGIFGLAAIIVSHRMQKRVVKRSEDLERRSQADSIPS